MMATQHTTKAESKVSALEEHLATLEMGSAPSMYAPPPPPSTAYYTPEEA